MVKVLISEQGACEEGYLLKPGDVLDLGALGLLVFYAPPESDAIRILQKSIQKKVNDAINWVTCEKGNEPFAE